MTTQASITTFLYWPELHCFSFPNLSLKQMIRMLSQCLQFNTSYPTNTWIFLLAYTLLLVVYQQYSQSSKSEIMHAFYNVLSLVLFVQVGVLEDFKIQLLGFGFLGPPSDSGQNPDLSGAGLSTTFT